MPAVPDRARRWGVSPTLAALLLVGLSDAAAAQQPAEVEYAASSARVVTTDPSVQQPERFWVADNTRYRSPWYVGKHRKMIPWGCTRAPYYPPDPRCKDNRGFHHGIDIAMRCGTKLFAGYRGRVVEPYLSGALGSAYGAKALRLRNFGVDRDFVIGHVRRVYVEAGQVVRKGELIARAGKLGAPDGCHLHFEVRPTTGSYVDAVDPRPYLHLRR